MASKIVEYNMAAIMDADGNEILKGFQIENITPTWRAELISAPIETGERVFDNKVLQPQSIRIDGNIQLEEYYDTISKMYQMWANRNYEFYSIATKSGVVYSDMCLEECPLKETPDKFDIVSASLTFKRMIITKVSSRQYMQPSDSNTVAGGTKGVS